MKTDRMRRLGAVLGIAALLAGVCAAHASDPQGAAQTVRIVSATTALLDSSSAAQLAKVRFGYATPTTATASRFEGGMYRDPTDDGATLADRR